VAYNARIAHPQCVGGGAAHRQLLSATPARGNSDRRHRTTLMIFGQRSACPVALALTTTAAGARCWLGLFNGSALAHYGRSISLPMRASARRRSAPSASLSHRNQCAGCAARTPLSLKAFTSEIAPHHGSNGATFDKPLVANG
jgi:hypothetical protein